MNFVGQRIFEYNLWTGLYMLDPWERYIFSACGRQCSAESLATTAFGTALPWALSSEEPCALKIRLQLTVLPCFSFARRRPLFRADGVVLTTVAITAYYTTSVISYYSGVAAP